MLNQNCTKRISSIHNPVTSSLFLLETLLCAFLSLVIYWKYNSINILNLKIRIAAISNTWWIIYFVLAGLRSLLNCIRYSLGSSLEGFFLADWMLGTVEVLILCFGLNYQRKYRSSAQINDEIDKYSQSETRNKRYSLRQGVFRTIASSGSILSLQALVTLVTAVMFALTQKNSNHIRWFWIYFGFSASFHLTALFLALVIFCKRVADGPTIMMKVLLVSAVLMLMPGDVPMWIWQECIKFHCMSNLVTLFDVWVLLKIASSLFIFLAVRFEFLRLQQECQWAMLNEVQRFSF